MMCVITPSPCPPLPCSRFPSVKEAPHGPGHGASQSQALRWQRRGGQTLQSCCVRSCLGSLCNFTEYCAQTSSTFSPWIQVKCYLILPSKCSPPEGTLQINGRRLGSESETSQGREFILMGWLGRVGVAAGRLDNWFSQNPAAIVTHASGLPGLPEFRCPFSEACLPLGQEELESILRYSRTFVLRWLFSLGKPPEVDEYLRRSRALHPLTSS